MSFFEIKSVMDVKDLLRHFGTIIYTGDQLGDYEMMEDEIRELYLEKMIDLEQFQGAMTVLKRAKNTCLKEK
jgi:uncharacterized protein YqgQ